MVYIATTDGQSPFGLSRLFSGRIASIIAVVAVASATSAWVAGLNPKALMLGTSSLNISESTFDDRFLPASAVQSSHLSSRLLVQAWSSELNLKLNQAKSRLAERLQSQNLLQQDVVQQPPSQQASSQQASSPQGSSEDTQTAVIEESKPAVAAAIPLPRSRPAEAKLEARSIPPIADAAAARTEDRTWLQKLSDLLPAGRLKLASLGPDDGLIGGGPDLAALGYDKSTAVYDISAHAVYMPNGSRLEAHSGIGRLMGDPEHVSQRMVGATPPAVYDLRPRERVFHGVDALRMIPQDSKATLGRSGLLVHPYMLGPNGDSNGCVSIKDYDRFLAAFKSGEVSHLVVVPSLNATAPDTRRADSQT